MLPRIRLKARTHTPLGEVFRTLFRDQRQRTAVGLTLMASQAFFYNAIFFTYALILTDFYGIRVRSGRLVHPAVRRRQLPRAGLSRAAVRHDWSPADDRVHLRDLGRAAGAAQAICSPSVS